MPVTHIGPDHPDFAKISATITPVELVRKQSFPKNIIFAEVQTSCRISRRRRESVDKLR